MNYIFNKKSKKSLKSSRRHISLGIPANIAVGPLGFRAELDVGPKGEKFHPYHNMGDRPDWTVIVDENDPRTSRIVFCDKNSEDKGLPAPGTSTLGAVVDTGHSFNPMSECFYFSYCGQCSLRPLSLSLPGETTGDIGGEEGKPVATATPINIVKEAVDRFGPLKAVLGTISTLHTAHKVHF